MTILVVVHGFPPVAHGGAEMYAHAQVRAFRDLFGDNIVVLTREADPTRSEYEVRTDERDGLRIVWVNNTFRRTRTFEDTYRNDAIGTVADRVIDEVKPDVAHVHHLTCLSTTIVSSLARRHIPCFVTLHDYWLMCHRGQLLDTSLRVCNDPASCRSCLGLAGSLGFAGFLGAAAVRTVERTLPATPARYVRHAAERLAAVTAKGTAAEDQSRRRIDHMRAVCADVTQFIAPSRHLRDRFVKFGVAPEKLIVSGYGFDHTPFARVKEGAERDRQAANVERTPSGRLRLGFLGSLMVSKAPHVLLEAIRRLPRGTVSVELFGAPSVYHGDDSYRQQLEPLLRQESVKAHGAIAHERVAQTLSSLDLLVVPSIWPENSPLVIHEAFLAGVPVVASRIGGIPEVVEDGRNGLLFRPGDAEDLARTLMRMVDEPGLLDRLRRGIPTIRTIEDDVRSTRQLYQKHLSSSARVGAFGCVADEPVRLAAVVLNYGTPDDTLLAVKSLVASTRPIDDIIVIDNDSAGGVREALKHVRQTIRYLPTGRNLGFSGGMNLGIRDALARGASHVLLVNSDVIVPPDCLAHLEATLAAAPNAGIVGPVVRTRSAPDEIESAGISYAPRSGRMRLRRSNDRDTEQGRDHGIDAVSGCLMLVTREVFEAVGLLDEEYFFSFEDLDFCLKARRAGFATLLASAATVYHEGSRSIGAGAPDRLYFGARNHLLMARRAGRSTSGRLALLGRTVSIVTLNLAHAVRSHGGSLPARLAAVVRGTRDYALGRFGNRT